MTTTLAYLPSATTPAAINPTLRTNESLTLSVLRRHNPQITSILSIAPYAVIYTFNVTLQTWEKSGTEGTLFVCQLTPFSTNTNTTAANHYSPSPEIERYAVIVLNRRGLENFTLELTSEDDVEVTPEYVILQAEEKKNTHKKSRRQQQHQTSEDDIRGNTATTAAGEEDQANQRIVYGLWIFAEPPPGSTAMMRETNAGVIQECARRAEASRRVAAAAAVEEEEQEAVQEERYRQEEGGGGGEGVGKFGHLYWSYENNPVLTTSTTTQHQFTGSGTSGGGGGGGGGGDLLGDLFRRATQGHNSSSTA